MCVGAQHWQQRGSHRATVGRAHPFYASHTVRQPCVEDRQLIEDGRHIQHQIRPFQSRGRIEAAPVVEHIRLQDLGVAAGEPPLVPKGEREDVRKRALRHVGVEQLLTPVHVEGQPRRGNGAAAELVLAVRSQRRRERLEARGFEVVCGLRAVQGVLVGDVPIIPHKAHRVSLPGVREELVKSASQLLGPVEEIGDRPHMLGCTSAEPGRDGARYAHGRCDAGVGER